jgi:hypothetical protein
MPDAHGWTSVEERLPDADGRYLVFTPIYDRGQFVAYFAGDRRLWCLQGFWSGEAVSHWRPLPPPPEAAG